VSVKELKQALKVLGRKTQKSARKAELEREFQKVESIIRDALTPVAAYPTLPGERR
jgi:hypothetical protein